MVTINNDIPLYAEELILNEEAISIQQILSQFKQPIPDKFVELNQLNWMCSTQGWKEPTCERYNCLIKGEWKQVDISHALLEKLELTKAKNIPYPVHISPTVLNKGLDRYFAYHVENNEEIFLQKPFTIENLEEDINKLLDKIKDLEKVKKENQGTIDNLQNLLGINNLNNLPVLPAGETLTSLLARPTLTQLNDLSREKDQELTTKNTQITNLTQQVNNLKTKLTATKNELEKEQKWWDKWFSSKNPLDGRKQTEKQNKELFQAIRTNLDLMIPAASDGYFVDYHITVRRYTNPTALYLTEEANNRVNSDFDSRKIIKAIYQYYRDR